MSVLYADTSALLRCYFDDEPEHEALAGLLLAQRHAVITSEMARIEVAGAAAAASRAGRIRNSGIVVRRFDIDTYEDGAVSLIRLKPESVLGLAQRLAGQHALRALDALHLATALNVAAHSDSLAFVTRDTRQARAAGAEGLPVL